MSNQFNSIKLILSGLGAAQLIATLSVYLSNLNLYHKMSLIIDAGYLGVPNKLTLKTLQRIDSAFYGGIFFTVSIGAGLALVSLAMICLIRKKVTGYKIYALFFILIWLICLFKLNNNGLCMLETAYFLLIPLVMGLASFKWRPEADASVKKPNIILFWGSFILLTALWGTQLSSHLFTDIRDHLLLTNPVGSKINNFYYKYTLYPAEIFKSLYQKNIKTCDLSKISDKEIASRLEKKLIGYDYLVLKNADKVDLKIINNGDHLFLQNQNQTVIKLTFSEFMSKSSTTLKEFSARLDKYQFFRMLTFYSLLIGFPIILYWMVFDFFRWLAGLFWDPPIISFIGVGISISIGILLFIPVFSANNSSISNNTLNAKLSSKHWATRMAALKYIEKKKIEISQFPQYKKMITSPYPQERYWLARAFAVSHGKNIFNDLLKMLNDPHPNVICQTFYALGRQGRPSAKSKIINAIQTSRHWYCQWYGYRALRKLGWKQTKLK